MRITDAFLGEHGVFYAQFDHFERALEDDDLECVKRRAALIACALEPHAHLENELLFDPIESRVGETAVLDVMRQEHEDIEAALHAIQATADLDEAKQLLVQMIEAARDHFGKEEAMAFPLAEEVLGDNELRVLGHEWAERRGVRLPERRGRPVRPPAA
jgi:hemerythrin-like domain-containing protein